MDTAQRIKPRPVVKSSFEQAGGALPRDGAPSPRLFEEICHSIREQVGRGELRPGDKLPSERDLAEVFGTSRPAVREALRELERGGVIEQRKGPRGGTYIRPVDGAAVTRSFSDFLSIGGISVGSLTESRTILQDAVVRLACRRGSDEDFDRLEESIAHTERLTREGKAEERRIQLLAFYRLLGRATGNEVMVILVESLTDMVLQIMARADVPQRTTTHRTLRSIVRALRERDEEKAASLMANHLNKLHAHFEKAEERQACDPG